MKVLIFSITAGEGHNSTAAALQTCLESQGIECDVLDTYGYISRALRTTVSKGYLLSTQKARRAYSGVYRLAEKRHFNANRMSPARAANSMIARKILQYIEASNPDAIVFTHVFVGIVLDLLKKKGKIKVDTIGIVTDFTIHPYWEESLHIDFIVTANELLDMQAKKKGFAEPQILPFGIPINPKFAKSIPAEAAREALGLCPRTPTLLIMSGSMGYGDIAHTIRDIDKVQTDFQIISVCGSNREAKAEIDRLITSKKLVNFGFVDNIDLLMDASDCIITKPGGLTTSEALAKRLPIIIVNPIPGQEERNTEFLVNNGVALAVSHTFPIAEAVFQLFSSVGNIAQNTNTVSRIELIKQSIDLIRRPNSTETLCDFIASRAELNGGKPANLTGNSLQ